MVRRHKGSVILNAWKMREVRCHKVSERMEDERGAVSQGSERMEDERGAVSQGI